MNRRISTFVAAIALAVAITSAQNGAPKLVVLIVVDQMRGDYIDNFQQQWTGGLHRILTEGARFRQGEYPYANTVTCVGHATISTGAYPSSHGMILNEWFDRAQDKKVACADDPASTIVSYGASMAGPGESSANLRAPALADELGTQGVPHGRVIAFSLKARSAVTLAGRRADAIAWFNDKGAWETSTYYSTAPVPAVAAFIKGHPVEADFGKVWDRALPLDRYLYETPAVGVTVGRNETNAFPHRLRGVSDLPDAAFYSLWQSSPQSDEYLAHMAESVAGDLDLGKGQSTDFIGISFSTLDRVGHEFGPNSHEVQDVLVRLDRTLGELFADLDRTVGRGNYTVALSADHGVAPLPERAVANGLDAGRASSTQIRAAVERAVAPTLGPGTHVKTLIDGDLYLATGEWARLKDDATAITRIRTELKTVPGVLKVYTRDELQANRFDDDPLGRRLARGYVPDRSGDLAILLKPYWFVGATGATHGSPNSYDTRVPVLLMGKGVKAGVYDAPAGPQDIAPTLAFLAGIKMPRAQGRVLSEGLMNR